MEKITTVGDLIVKTTAIKLLDALSDLGMDLDELNDGNFWMVREQCRINNGTYTPIQINGDDKMRFLHVSIDDPAKVSYTKNSDKGKQDIQTRTTLSAYCEKFGLEIPPVFPVRNDIAHDTDAAAQSMSDSIDAEVLAKIRSQTKTSVREKLGMIQDLIDEVLADLG